MTTVLDGLKEAKKLITTPDQWAQGVYEVKDYSSGNYRRCVLGACRKAFDYNGEGYFNYVRATTLLSKCGYELFDVDSPTRVNDKLGFDAVHKMLDCAIEKAGEATS